MKVHGGIDLGASFASISWVDPATGRAERSHLLTPDRVRVLRSCVCYPAGGQPAIVGEEAWQRLGAQPERVIVAAPRFLGSRQKFEAIEGIEHSPEEVCAEILRALARQARDRLGQAVGEVVITAPVWAALPPEGALCEAARLASLNVLSLLPDAHAALLGLAAEEPSLPLDKPWLVFDMGGTACVVSVLRLAAVKGREGWTVPLSETLLAEKLHIGGAAWDQALMDLVVARGRGRLGSDLAGTPEARLSLLAACEKAKRSLTAARQVLRMPVGDHAIEITESELEEQTASLRQACADLLEQVLQKAEAIGINRHSLGVLLAGGGSRLRRVRQLVADTLRVPIIEHPHPDLLATVGAAYWAHSLRDRFPDDQIMTSSMRNAPLASSSGPKSSSAGKSPEQGSFIVRGYGPMPPPSPERSRTDEPDSDAVMCSPGETEASARRSMVARMRCLLAAMFKQPSATAPEGVINRVHFSATSPPSVEPGASFVMDVWAHLEQQRAAVVQRAKEAAVGRILVKSKGPVAVAGGAVLQVHLAIDGMTIAEPEDTITWQGEIGNATFAVSVPEEAPPGNRPGQATVYLNGLRIARLCFGLQVGRPVRFWELLPTAAQQHCRAFASYASEDRSAVMARIQGMQKANPRLEVFVDVLSLRSGQDWQQTLWQVIPRNDVFYLFWSASAQRSRWVEMEWRCALQTRGLDFIDPVPLVSPEEVPPPPELARKHFNDWTLAFARASVNSGIGATAGNEP
jgi:actin-like ATPase involved in cell morphogenesis